MGVDQQRLDEARQIAGFFVPVWVEEYGEQRVQLLQEKDAEKILAGYGCPECLADFGAIYRAVCPLCHHERDPSKDMVAPPEIWTDHVRAREQADVDVHAWQPTQTMQDFVLAKEREGVSVRKLMPSKWGRGRPK